MDPYKKNRLAAAIQRTLSDLISAKVKDPRVGLVSISQVELNRDNSQARVFVTVTGDEEDRDKSMTGLIKAAGFLQSQVGRVLKMRTVPQLYFEHDDSMDRGFGVEEVLRGLEQQGEFIDAKEKRRRLRLEDFEPDRDLVEPLRAAETVWLAGHWNPDPDCIGAALALAEVLRGMDKDVVVFRYPEPPRGLTKLPGWKDTEPMESAPELLAEEAPDLAVLVDCHRTDRTGPLQDTLDRLENVVCIDHHLVTGRRAPAPGWVDDRAESTCSLAYRLIQVLTDDDPEAIDVDVATNLFAGLSGDTGGFRYDNVGPSTFRLAAELADRGVDTAAVQQMLLHQRRREGMDLMQRALASIRYSGGGRIAVMTITREMLKESGAVMSETEGLVNMMTAVEGVTYAALLKELEPGTWRVSLRTNGGDVQAVAAAFGGGGHKAAAGCTLEGDHDDVAAAMTEALLGAE